MSAQTGGDETSEHHFNFERAAPAEAVQVVWGADALRERLRHARELIEELFAKLAIATERAAKLTGLLSNNGTDRSVHGNAAPVAQGGDATIHSRTGLYIAILALVIGGLCLGLFLMQFLLMPQLIDSKISAGVAAATIQADEARANARDALKEVESLCASLRASEVKSVECR